MTNFSFDAPLNTYTNYLNNVASSLKLNELPALVTAIEQTNWEEPTSASDLNNFAVITLIEAELTQDLSLRAFNTEIAIEALQQGSDLKEYPLCKAHLALVRGMLGEVNSARQIAYANFIESLQELYNSQKDVPLGLIYLPKLMYSSALLVSERLEKLLSAKNGQAQTLLFQTEVLCRSRLVFYNAVGKRFLQLANQVDSTSAALNLQLGLASLMNKEWEGLLYLQKAHKINPNNASILQALYLAYRKLNSQQTAQFWLETAQVIAKETPSSSSNLWKWTELSLDNPFTYVPFQENLLLSVEANLYSIVTSVLMLEGDWFEAEMEFWRDQLKLGMTVIDVGASVGVYTFSAADQVGSTGRVLAIEPFSSCVRCLHETCRINDLPQVSVHVGAASNYSGTAKLALHEASELNEVTTEDVANSDSGNFEEITCFTLDNLVEKEKLKRVDWLKIDAEGHETKVLEGSHHLLSQFAPNILYENIAGHQSSNIAMAEMLIEKGYKLFYYQPFLKQLLPVNSRQELFNQLNIIALPSQKVN